MKLNKSLRSQHGFSLLEVLVTSMIVAVGVVGIVMLQVQQLRSTRAALVSSQAAILVSDISDRLRVNSGQIASYETEYDDKASDYTKDCKSNSCNAIEMSNFDLKTWKSTLENKLPSGGGKISTDVNNLVTVTIYWDQNNSGSTTTTCPPQNITDLDCLEVSLGEIN